MHNQPIIIIKPKAEEKTKTQDLEVKFSNDAFLQMMDDKENPKVYFQKPQFRLVEQDQKEGQILDSENNPLSGYDKKLISMNEVIETLLLRTSTKKESQSPVSLTIEHYSDDE